MCRALIITCIVLSFFGSILVLVGMKCTKIGGSEITNAKVTFAGGMNYLIGGKNPKRPHCSTPNDGIFKLLSLHCFRHVFNGVILLLWTQNQFPVSGQLLQRTEVCATHDIFKII